MSAATTHRMWNSTTPPEAMWNSAAATEAMRRAASAATTPTAPSRSGVNGARQNGR
jgi:hypothetical protein